MKLFKTTCALLLFIMPLLVSEKVFAQSLSISAVNTNFFLNNSAGLTTAATISNAFSIDVQSGNNTYYLSASITAKNFNPSGVVFPAIPFVIQLKSLTGIQGNISGQVTNPLQLAESPASVALANQATKTSNRTAVWTYDLTLNPIGYTIPPGTYVFTVTVAYSGGSNITQSFNITLNVQSVIDLALIQNSSTTVNFGSSGNYSNGISISNFHSTQVSSNVPWLISVASQSAYFTAGSAGASNNMPASVMGIRPAGSPSFTPVSTSATTIKTGNRGDISAAGNTTAFDVNFNPGYNYNPGIYNISLTYTLTNQ